MNVHEEQVFRWAGELANQEGYRTPSEVFKAYDAEVLGR